MPDRGRHFESNLLASLMLLPGIKRNRLPPTMVWHYRTLPSATKGIPESSSKRSILAGKNAYYYAWDTYFVKRRSRMKRSRISLRKAQWKNVCACSRAWVQKRIIWRQNGGRLTAILRDYKTQIVAMPISSVRMIFCANNDRCVPNPKVL